MEKRHRAPRERSRASTLEILGLAHENGNVPRKWAEHYTRLKELRAEFAGKKERLNDTVQLEVSPFSQHMADAATDSYDRDWALAMASSAQNALYEIEQALNRIANGTYGTCELTGQPIETPRLRAVPWTRFSAPAQAELETRGLGGRIQLGDLGSYLNGSESKGTEEDEEELLEKRAA